MVAKEEKLTLIEKKRQSLQRAQDLKNIISDYLDEYKKIPTGFDNLQGHNDTKQKILAYFDATEANWLDWKWQIKHRITQPETLARFIQITSDEIEEIKNVSKHFRWAVSPYFVSLMDPVDSKCPVRQQAIPSIKEILSSTSCDDPMTEELTSPAPRVTRRYPDRLIINVTNRCAVYCRHCQRRRNLGTTDKNSPKSDLLTALEYIEANKEIRDVLLTGGDALFLSDHRLDWLLTQLDNISHVEIKRIGTRVPVTLPQRITPELCRVLKKHPPIYLNTQFNHPKEITPEAARACDLLVQAGVVLGNQSVLLKGINNNPHIIKKLNQELLKIRVRPYYLFQAIGVTGTHHFTTKIEEGIEIMDKLRGYTSGLAVPYYIINVPNGLGKIPILPEYILSRNNRGIALRTWEGKTTFYSDLDNPKRS